MCFPVNLSKFLLLWTTASDFICGVFFIFSIIKNFRHEISRFVQKKFDLWKSGLKHIKEISKQKVTFDRIISYLKKNEEITNHDEIQQILDKLISENRIEVRGKSYFISTTVDTVLVPETQLTDEVEEENNTFITPLVEETVHPDTTQKDEMLQSILDELKKFRSFQDSVENKLYRMEEAIISNASAQKYSPNFPENTSNRSEIVLSI